MKGRVSETPMDTRGQSVDTGGQKRMIWILLYYRADGRYRSHCRYWVVHMASVRMASQEDSVDSVIFVRAQVLYLGGHKKAR